MFYRKKLKLKTAIALMKFVVNNNKQNYNHKYIYWTFVLISVRLCVAQTQRNTGTYSHYTITVLLISTIFPLIAQENLHTYKLTSWWMLSMALLYLSQSLCILSKLWD